MTCRKVCRLAPALIGGMTLQIIVCADGAAGINFEHTGVDGHTVLRHVPAASNMFAADVLTEGLMLLTHSINPSAPTLFHVSLSPHAKSFKPPKSTANGNFPESSQSFSYDTSPSRFMWTLTPSIRGGIRPDVFVQMAFQAEYFGLYDQDALFSDFETLDFLHGRTEAARTVQPESINFTKTLFSECLPHDKIRRLHKACERDRSVTGNLDLSPDDPIPTESIQKNILPSIFANLGWDFLSTSILSTSNCGTPALRLFGFGSVAADGYCIGHTIEENGISVVASSKHLQTHRFLDALQGYLLEVQRISIQLHRFANERAAPFVDHAGILRDSKTGRPINGHSYESDESRSDYEDTMPGYSFFDNGDIDLLGRRKRSPYANIGKVLPLSNH
ncbi:CoA-dependent acyltransferase [Suillus brevipes Sb2]|nr:CoA-dependent acyltransferase [Suillus brevipes Sb2]